MELTFKNVIIAEDDCDISDIYRDKLKEYTQNIIVVRNGVELINIVLELLKSNEYIDLILLDDKMPLKNGFDCIQILPSLIKKFDQIRIIVISGAIANKGPGVPTELKNVCLLQKPFKMENLDRCLKCCSLNLRDYCVENNLPIKIASR